MNNQISILVLAGEVKSLNKKNFLYEYLLNIGNSLAFQRIIKSLKSKEKFNIYLALNNINKKFIRFKPFKEVTVIDVGFTQSISDTIYKSLSQIKEDNIQIIPITTIPDNSNLDIYSCYFSNKKIPKENWSSIRYLKGQEIEYLFKENRENFGINSFPFTGRIFANKTHLSKVIEKLSQLEKKDLMHVSKHLIEDYSYQIKHEKWFDIGHDTTYLETRISSISSRYFNQIEYNRINNSIIKKSLDSKKIVNEYSYYENLPLNMRQFFPYHFVDNNLNSKRNIIELEFISNPNLAEIFLFKDIGPNAWLRIINSISRVFNQIYNAKNLKNKGNLNFLYSKKLEIRLKQFEDYISRSKDENLNKIYKNKLLINGKFQINSLKETVDKLLPALKNYENDRNQFIGHGDMCFNNILVEPISGNIKLIDPKSEYNKSLNIWGLMDPFYDLAKLNHSFKYLYDSIVNDLFIINYSSFNIDLKIYAPLKYQMIYEIFQEKLIMDNINQDLLRILSANLFISMLPLHSDDKDRMAAFAIIGNIIFSNLEFDQLIIKL